MFEIINILKKSDHSRFSNDWHVKAAMHWLCRAQDSTTDAGVSIRFHLLYGWGSSYPETTGYIIPTFLKCSDLYHDKNYKDRAIKMAEWELSIQQSDGSFIGGDCDNPVGKLIFDTGQIIFGFLSTFKYTKDTKFLDAALKAGNWLLINQDKRGCWLRYSLNSIPHAYHSRVAWALAKLYTTTDDKKKIESVHQFCNWLISNQLTNGWFKEAGFTKKNHLSPYTHTIAYTIRGLLEIGILLKKEQYIIAAQKSAEALFNRLEPEGFFWGKYDNSWSPRAKFICLTGNAQLSIIFGRLYQITNNELFLRAMKNLNSFLKKTQYLAIEKSNIYGAIPGSKPIWGEYERFSYPNWATKFFIDALLLEKILDNNMD